MDNPFFTVGESVEDDSCQERYPIVHLNICTITMYSFNYTEFTWLCNYHFAEDKGMLLLGVLQASPGLGGCAVDECFPETGKF